MKLLRCLAVAIASALGVQLAACGESGGGGSDAGSDSDGDADADAGTDSDADSGTDSDTDTDADADTVTPGPVPGDWIEVAAGSFTMGSPTDDPCRNVNEDLHEVQITIPFEMMATEVTIGWFEEVMGYTPSTDTACGDDCPEGMLTWDLAAAYCNALSPLAGLESCYACAGSGADTTCNEIAEYDGGAIAACTGYRLPTEAEWEYAYRAGTSGQTYNGPLEACDGLQTVLDEIAWYRSNSGNAPHPVATKEPNAWGFHDGSGNVWEWTNDRYIDFLGYDLAVDPGGAAAGENRVMRGGSFA